MVGSASMTAATPATAPGIDPILRAAGRDGGVYGVQRRVGWAMASTSGAVPSLVKGSGGIRSGRRNCGVMRGVVVSAGNVTDM